MEKDSENRKRTQKNKKMTQITVKKNTQKNRKKTQKSEKMTQIKVNEKDSEK